jgi:hypothetical protein
MVSVRPRPCRPLRPRWDCEHYGDFTIPISRVSSRHLGSVFTTVNFVTVVSCCDFMLAIYNLSGMHTLDVIVILLVLLRFAAMVAAWTYWLRSPIRFPPPAWRSSIFFLALLAGSANILSFWGYVIWLQRHYNPEAWKVADRTYGICLYFMAFTIFGALFGRGRSRGILCAAGVLGWFLWVTTSIGVL